MPFGDGEQSSDFFKDGFQSWTLTILSSERKAVLDSSWIPALFMRERLYWQSFGGHRFVWMNLYELKQPLKNKEPTYFIIAPAPHALTGPHTSVLWIMEEKKITVQFLDHRIQDGSRLYKELTHWGKKACKQKQEVFTQWVSQCFRHGRRTWVTLLESTLVYVSGFY